MNKIAAILATVFMLLTFSPAYTADLNKLNQLQTYASVALEIGCSGAVIEQEKNYYVTTAAHCVKDNELFTKGETQVTKLDLMLVRINRAKDTAIYKVMNKELYIPFTFKLADPFDVQAGEDVWVIGNPCWFGDCLDPFSVTKGILSYAFRYNKKLEMTVHQVNVPLRGGYSGAPLLNDELEIIGTVSFGKPGLVMTPMGPMPVDEGAVLNYTIPVVYTENLTRSL